MRFRFEMDGETYSKHKDSFKRLLAKHGLRWRGSLDRPFWASGTERVSALFDREAEKDVLRSASLIWESASKSRLLEDLKAWAWEIGAKASEDRPGASRGAGGISGIGLHRRSSPTFGDPDEASMRSYPPPVPRPAPWEP